MITGLRKYHFANKQTGRRFKITALSQRKAWKKFVRQFFHGTPLKPDPEDFPCVQVEALSKEDIQI